MSVRILLAGVAVTILGMSAAFIGIMAPGIFVAATRVILLGLLLCAGAGVYALVRPDAARDEAGART